MTNAHDNPHDRLSKFAFGRKEGAKALLALALPPDVFGLIDFSTLRLVSGNLIGDLLREGLADLLFSASCDGALTLIHLLIEHKSGPERWLILDLFESCGRIWRSWRTANPHARQAPRILPIVLFHGPRSWSAPRALDELLAGGPDLVHAIRRYDPTLPVLMVDLAEHADGDLTRLGDIDALAAAALWMLKWSRAIDFATRLIDHVELLARVLGSAGGENSFRQLIHYALAVGSSAIDADRLLAGLARHLPKNAENVMKTMAEELIERGLRQGREQGLEQGREQGLEQGREQGLEQGREQGLEQGREQGLEQGRGIGELVGLRTSIERVLAARFCAAPDDVRAALARIDTAADLQRLLDTAAVASIADVRRALTG